jgi:predicted nucleotidyltransferase
MEEQLLEKMKKINNNNLSQKTHTFFYELQDYLDNDFNTEMYFYGSVQRFDYFPGQSDIDIGILTDNEYSIMNKMQHFLKVDKKEFIKVAWKLNGRYIYGYKLKYENPKLNIIAEFAIFNNKFKNILIQEHYRTINIPFFTSCLVVLLKFFYYAIPLLPTKVFAYLKRKLFNDNLGIKDSSYLTIKHSTFEKVDPSE